MSDYSNISVGMDIGYDAVRMVALARSGEGLRLHRFAVESYETLHTPLSLFRKPDDILQAVRKLVEKHYEPDWPVTFGLRNRFAAISTPQIEKRSGVGSELRCAYVGGGTVSRRVARPLYHRYRLGRSRYGHGARGAGGRRATRTGRYPPPDCRLGGVRRSCADGGIHRADQRVRVDL